MTAAGDEYDDAAAEAAFESRIQRECKHTARVVDEALLLGGEMLPFDLDDSEIIGICLTGPALLYLHWQEVEEGRLSQATFDILAGRYWPKEWPEGDFFPRYDDRGNLLKAIGLLIHEVKRLDRIARLAGCAGEA